MKNGNTGSLLAALLIGIILGAVMGAMGMRIAMTPDAAPEGPAPTVSQPAGTWQEGDSPDPMTLPGGSDAPAVQEEPQEPVSSQPSRFNGDVESEVTRIRGIYNDIVAGMTAGAYEVRDYGSGIQGYFDDAGMAQCVVIPKGVGGVDYSRWLYYENNALIFAYYEAADSHRLYFYEDLLMRWRYCPDAQNGQDATNMDWGSGAAYEQWEALALAEAYTYVEPLPW